MCIFPAQLESKTQDCVDEIHLNMLCKFKHNSIVSSLIAGLKIDSVEYYMYYSLFL